MTKSEAIGARETIIQTLVDLMKEDEVLADLKRSDVEALVDTLIQSDSEPDDRRTRKILSGLIESIAKRRR